MIYFRPPRSCLAALSLAALLGMGNSFADPHDTFWSGGAGDFNWSSTKNWSDNAVPDDGAMVRITGNSTETSPIKFSSGNGIRNLIFDSGYLEIAAGSLPVSIGATIGNSSTDSAVVTIDAGASLGRESAPLDLGTVDKATAIINLHGGTLSGVITVGANATASATVKGYGTISGINQGTMFTLKGQLIASGGTLTLSKLNANLYHDHRNSDGTAGWYAVSGGKIVTPDATASDYAAAHGADGRRRLGLGRIQAADGGSLTMVNSVAVRYKAADPGASCTASGGEPARDRQRGRLMRRLREQASSAIGMSGTAAGSTDLTVMGLNFRYDPRPWLQNGEPVLYFWNGTAWDKLPRRPPSRPFLSLTTPVPTA